MIRIAKPLLLAFLLAFIGGAQSQPQLSKVKEPWVELQGVRYHVEVARSRQEIEKGLMFRESMPRNQGMLFVFSREIPLSFWMKNTLIPLDVLYFDTRGRLVDYKENASPCTADPCPLYPSSKPAMYVLELNTGEARKLKVKTGSILTASWGVLSP